VVTARLATLGMPGTDVRSPADFSAFVDIAARLSAKLVKDSGAKPE
jgi:hypothetical protein